MLYRISRTTLRQKTAEHVGYAVGLRYVCDDTIFAGHLCTNVPRNYLRNI